MWNDSVDQTRTAEAEGFSPSMAGTKYSKDILLRRAQTLRNVNGLISSQDFIGVQSSLSGQCCDFVDKRLLMCAGSH